MAEISTLNGYKIKDKKAIRYYNTVADMVADTTLKNGMHAITKGYYTVNDGGGSDYHITNTESTTDYQVELNNGLYGNLIIKNKIINVKQFGAKGDGNTDDSLAIQRAIDYFHIGSNADNQNYGIVIINNYPDAGGTVYFPKGVYCISSTIKIPCYVDIDFGFSTIKAISGGAFINNYMFSVNSYSLEAWTYAYVSRKGFIKSGFIDGNNIENIRGFYILDPHKLTELEFKSMYNGITYPGGYYIDTIFIDHCGFIYSKGDDYQIKKRCYGESLQISNIEFEVTTTSGTASNGIEVFRGHSGIIRNIINGNIYMFGTDNVVISNWHCERGNLISLESNGTIIKDSTIYIRDNSTPITLNGDNANNNLRTILLENVNFIYYLTLDQYNYDTKDIDISTYFGQIFIKGCYRELWTESIKAIAKTGIALFDGTNYILNPYDECEVYNKKIIPKCSNVRSDIYILNSVATNNNVNWNLSIGTYYYKMINLCDSDKLCGKVSDEKSVTISSIESGARIVIPNSLGKGNIIRLYRGTASGTYTHYVDIPNPKNANLYDNGYSINGYKWISSNNSVPTVNAITQIERIDNYGSILARCKGYGSPTIGSWTQGDIIERLNPSANNNLGWVCTVTGTPGTWKAYGNIES